MPVLNDSPFFALAILFLLTFSLRLMKTTENERWQIFAALSSLDYAGQLARLDRLRTKGTCSWLANDPMYIRWRNASTSCGLCCRGIRRYLLW